MSDGAFSALLAAAGEGAAEGADGAEGAEDAGDGRARAVAPSST